MRIILVLFIALIAAMVLFATMVGSCSKSMRFTTTTTTTYTTTRQTKYPVLNAEVIKAIPDDDLDLAIIDHVDSKIGLDDEHAHQAVASMAKGIQVIYATWSLEAVVNVGGFSQYFGNPSADFRNDALEGFKSIGAVEHEKLMAEAIEVYQQQKVKELLKVFSRSDKDNPFNKLDDTFGKLNLTENVTPFRVKYIRQHPELFNSK